MIHSGTSECLQNNTTFAFTFSLRPDAICIRARRCILKLKQVYDKFNRIHEFNLSWQSEFIMIVKEELLGD